MKKYSILIPTRNGASYVTYAVKSVLEQNYPHCEVIVSVNHSTDNTLDILSQIHDPRLKVVVPPKPLSMTAHFEWLLNQACGQWVTFIGDDDALMPYFFKKLDAILEKWKEVEAIAVRPNAYYFWKGCEETYGKNVVIFKSSEGEKLVKGPRALFFAIAGIKAFTDLPQLYTNGIIRNSLIEKIKAKSQGKFYHEITPDVYSSVAITSSLKHYLQIETPLFWVGSSPKSVGMAVTQNSLEKSAENAHKTDEFIEMAKNDGFGIANEVGQALWKQALLCTYLFSALRSLPFRTKYFHAKWVDYLIFARIRHEIEHLKKNGIYDKAINLEKAFQAQVKVLCLKKHFLEVSSLFLKLLHKLAKFRSKCVRLVTKFKKRPSQFNSQDDSRFPTIEMASREILRLMENH